jgi:hypothetical protein
VKPDPEGTAGFAYTEKKLAEIAERNRKVYNSRSFGYIKKIKR